MSYDPIIDQEREAGAHWACSPLPRPSLWLAQSLCHSRTSQEKVLTSQHAFRKKKYVFLTPEFSVPQALSACTISHLALTSGTRKFMGLRMSMQPAGPSSLYNHPPKCFQNF